MDNKTVVLHIKNMVCPRCIHAVRDLLEGLGIEVLRLKLGYAEISLSEKIELSLIEDSLKKLGFSLLKNSRQIEIDKIKSVIIEYLDTSWASQRVNEPLMDVLVKSVGKNYFALSKAFSEMESRTIETYVIMLKIEKAKELIEYGELSMSQIADELHYSSVQYFSKQFKQMTGMTPTHYRTQSEVQRVGRDEV